MTPAELYAEMRKLSLPHLISYHPTAKDDGPAAPWTYNKTVGANESGWAPIRAVKPADLFPATPFDPSRFRPGGYALWDFLVRNGQTAMRRNLTPDDCGPIIDPTTSVRGVITNNWWFTTMQNLWMSGSVGTDPEVAVAERRQRILDTGLALDYHRNRPLLELAHALAHCWTGDQVKSMSFWARYTLGSRAFLEAAAGLAAASLFGIPVNLRNREQLLAHGVKVFPTTRCGFLAGKPVLQIPFQTDCGIDGYLACLSVAVMVGPDPIDFLLPGAHRSSEDRFAYEPGLVIVVGWESPAWVYGQELCRYERVSTFDKVPGAFTAAACDLMPPGSLRTFLEAAQTAWPAKEDYRPVESWLGDPWVKDLIVQTPPLPCLQCLLLNRRTEQGLRLPDADTLRADRLREKYESEVKRAMRRVYLAKVAGDKLYRKASAERRALHAEVMRQVVHENELKDKVRRGCRIRY